MSYLLVYDDSNRRAKEEDVATEADVNKRLDYLRGQRVAIRKILRRCPLSHNWIHFKIPAKHQRFVDCRDNAIPSSNISSLNYPSCDWEA